MTESKKKRAATRYPYVADAQCIKEDQVLSCQLQDISTSGIQIVSPTLLGEEQQISLVWEDAEEGEIEGVFYVMRKFQKEDKENRHFYGLRYYQLDAFCKQKVLNVLNKLKNVQKKESEKISLESIYEVVDQGQRYIVQNLSNLKEVHPFFAKPLEDLSSYEKEVFEGEVDPYKEVIQSFVTAHFQCVLLKNVVPFALKKPKRIPSLLSRAVKVLKTIEETESKEEAIFDYIKDFENAADLRMQYNESTNRVFYSKQGMMGKIVKSVESVQLLPELQEYLNIISKRYDHTIELTNPNIGLEDIHTVSKHPPVDKKDKDKSKDKDKAKSKFQQKYYVPSLETKGVGKKVFLVLMILGIISVNVFNYFNKQQETNKYISAIKLPIPITEAYRDGTQLFLLFKPQDWAKLDEVRTNEIKNKVKDFMANDKWVRTTLLRTDDADIKMIITTLQ
ncbi:MAG: PilZ domain-containing protein [Bdellovibrionales bacterium]|nr:PilZ domain-containing protein [Bdellovibrionales bacterium]